MREVATLSGYGRNSILAKEYKHLETKLIHAGKPDPLICGAVTSHAGVSPEDRRAIGISDSLIRLSVGLESTEDMIEDFAKAFTQ